MKMLIAVIFSIFPLIGMAEFVNDFQIGSISRPTIDGQFIEETTDNKVEEKSPKSKLIPIEISKKPSVHAPSKDWSESQVAAILEKAASGGKLAYILNAAKRYDLPASVALIPVIESDYQTHAVSPKGAVGLWQLSKAVAYDFDLPEKARSDWRASTEVALQHLSKLKKHYGRWDLVWAAYNAGQGRIDTAIKSHPKAKNALSLDLPDETFRYVEKLSSLHATLANMDIQHV